MLRTLTHLFLGIASQIGALQEPGQVIIVLDASSRMAQTGVADTAIFDTVSDAVAAAVTHPPENSPRLRIGLRLAGGEPAAQGLDPCESTTLVLPPAEVQPEQWELATAGHRPGGDCPLIHTIIAGLGDFSSVTGAARVVVISAGGDDCDGSREQVAHALADGQLEVDLRVVGILMPPESAPLFDGIPLRNVVNPDDLEATLKWAVFEGHHAKEPEAPETPAVSVRSPSEVLAGEPIEINWNGPDATEDFISLASPGASGNAYSAWERTDGGSPIVLTAPLQPGSYEIRYVSGTGAEVLARSAIEVVAAPIQLEAPAAVISGQRFEIRWTGSTAPGDFVALSRPDAPTTRFFDWASTAAGSPVTLAAPSRPGSYEVRFIRKSGLEILASAPLEVRP